MNVRAMEIINMTRFQPVLETDNIIIITKQWSPSTCTCFAITNAHVPTRIESTFEAQKESKSEQFTCQGSSLSLISELIISTSGKTGTNIGMVVWQVKQENSSLQVDFCGSKRSCVEAPLMHELDGEVVSSISNSLLSFDIHFCIGHCTKATTHFKV